ASSPRTSWKRRAYSRRASPRLPPSRRTLQSGRRSISANSAGWSRTLPSTPSVLRSEEHTSELQSRFDLVCRLLLEKKKYIIERHIIILYFTLTILIGNLCSSTNLINY